ncbi:MAG: hypothetical protein ACJ0BD_00395 [Gammaproteobacteria bacterium]|tara:strand:- start:13 stop:735 length:723 start_codon:yes stop_codon:yes gene_type:complete
MNETLEQKLSLLLDGEVTPFETKRLVDEINCNPRIKALWLRMNKQRAALRGELIDPSMDLSQYVMSSISSNQTSYFSQKTLSWRHLDVFSKHYLKACCYLLGFFTVLSMPLINLNNFQLSSSSSSSLSKNSAPINTTLMPNLSNESLLVDLGSSFNGSLKNFKRISSNAIEANYQLLNTSEDIRIKVFFKGVSEQERFNLMDRGITFHARAGNAPVVLNVSSDQVSNKKLIKISNSFLKD